MGEFFRPLRRKIGVVTLAMACVLAVGWVRSLVVLDNIAVTNRGRIFQFGTAGGVISLGCTWMGEGFFYDGEDYAWRTKPIDTLQIQPSWPLQFSRDVFYIRRSIRNECIGLRVHYWSVVLPLTALSTYLLLSKPRVPAPKKIADPTPAEGT